MAGRARHGRAAACQVKSGERDARAVTTGKESDRQERLRRKAFILCLSAVRAGPEYDCPCLFSFLSAPPTPKTRGLVPFLFLAVFWLFYPSLLEAGAITALTRAERERALLDVRGKSGRGSNGDGYTEDSVLTNNTSCHAGQETGRRQHPADDIYTYTAHAHFYTAGEALSPS